VDPHSLVLVTTLLFIFTAAVAGGFFAHALKIPMLLGYITMGIVFGNVFPRFSDVQTVHQISDIGVTLLLFTLGVELSFHRLRHTLGTVFWAAFFQMVLVTSFLFFVLFGLMALPFLPALFISIAGSLSSTVVIVKILFEKGELDSKPGEILTGWSVIQDLAVIPIMILLPVFVSTYTSGTATLVGTTGIIALQLVKAGAAILIVLFFGKTGVPFILNRVARLGSREVFLTLTIAIVFVSALCAYAFGLSAGLGAFIAGLLIAETSQNHMVFAEVRPLRDIFATIFFVSLGMSIPLSTIFLLWPLIIGMTLLIVLLKFVVVFLVCRFLGYHPKTSWLVGLGLLPMSEFGFILAKEGVSLGALSSQDFILCLTLVIGTIALSTPIFLHGQTLYYRLKHLLGDKIYLFGRKTNLKKEINEELPFQNHVVICGYGRVGKYVGRALEMAGVPLVVVDYNQTTITGIKEKGITVVYGDPADRDVLDKAQVDFAKVLIIAIPDRHTQELIIGHALTLNKNIQIICRTHHEEDQMRLKSLGVQVIVQPEFEAALSIIHRLLPEYGVVSDDLSGKISRLKIEHGVG
jgi:CPA2 family monovalent cation:H+ antiporter-2